MALVHWKPVRELETLEGEVNRLFDSFLNGSGSRARRWMPAMDLVEEGDQLVLRADLPGLGEDDIEIEVKDSVLTVSGERKAESEERGDSYYRVERAVGRFSRSLMLPEGIDPEAVSASFDRGVLEVRIPKPEARKPHRVEIGRGRSVEAEASEKS